MFVTAPFARRRGDLPKGARKSPHCLREVLTAALHKKQQTALVIIV